MAASNSATLLKTPRRMRLPVISAKKRSTRFSQDDEVGMKFEAWMFFKPRLNFLCLVRRIVIDDQMEIEMSGHSAVDLPQEPDEFFGAMARQTFADDGAGLHIERGEQRCCAVALVVVCHCGRTAPLHRQARLRAVERLDLAFLVDAEHQRLVRRVHVEADD